MAQKTIAILGDTGNFPASLISVFAGQKFRLLYISENEDNILALKKQLNQIEIVAEVEFISCEREGCWEADLIVFTHLDRLAPSLIEKIKEVATQKIVIAVYCDKKQIDLDGLFPYSKVVEIAFDTQENQFSVSGKEDAVNTEIENIIKLGNYKTKIIKRL